MRAFQISATSRYVNSRDINSYDYNCCHVGTIQETNNLQVIPFGITCIDSALPSGGLARGALHEFLYNDPLEPRALACTIPALIAFNAHADCASRSHRSQWNSPQGSLQHYASLPRTLWIGKRAWPTPPALAGLTASHKTLAESFFEHSLFIDPPNDAATLWAIDLALRSHAIDLIVAACPSITRTTTQRLSIAAKKYGTTAILLRSHSDYAAASCAASRWSIAPTPSTKNAPAWRLSLAKLRGGLLIHGEWIVSMHAPDLFHSNNQTLNASKAHSTDNTTNQIGSAEPSVGPLAIFTDYIEKDQQRRAGALQ